MSWGDTLILVISRGVQLYYGIAQCRRPLPKPSAAAPALSFFYRRTNLCCFFLCCATLLSGVIQWEHVRLLILSSSRLSDVFKTLYRCSSYIRPCIS